jgi:hypothetical protein
VKVAKATKTLILSTTSLQSRGCFRKEKNMIEKFLDFILGFRSRQLINIALAKGGAMMLARVVDLKNPASWEFSGFSQNGEDGILEVLRKNLSSSNRYFIEIGSSDGIENNSAWLAVAEKYSGLMIDGNEKLIGRARKFVQRYSIGMECHAMFVTPERIADLKKLAFHHDPDVFSLDIDGNDYYIAKAIFQNGFRPKIFVVEYNSAFGPERSVTIEYKRDFVFTQAHPTQLYYGVSIMGWKNFFAEQGYRFVTVDRNGVNAFFVDPLWFDTNFLDAVQGLDFAENQYQYTKFREPHQAQFERIADQKLVSISKSGMME